MPKRLIICCDGTWNTADQMCEGQPCPTNVAKFARAVGATGTDGMAQRVYYLRGVGTSRLERLRGGAFGFGLSDNVQEAYRTIAEEFDPGDEIFLLGFSRGAFTARSTAGLIRNAGVLRREHLHRIGAAYALYRDASRTPDHIEAGLFRGSFSHETRIRFIGVWDTVGALGIPLSGVPAIDRINKRWAFHDTRLSSSVDAAFHAVAIDERRRPFLPTMWEQGPNAGDQRLEQVWFSGVHCDIGGGYLEAGLSDHALGWMMQRAADYGVGFDGAGTGAGDPRAVLHDSMSLAYRLLGPVDRAIGAAAGGRETVHASALQRLEEVPQYRPPGLLAYRRARSR